MPDIDPPTGGAFLMERGACSAPARIFTPDQFPVEARLLARAVEDFVRREVVPANARLEAHETGLMRGVLRKAGELGILGTAVPEKFGGLDLPKSQIALLTEAAAIHPSFAISAGVHSGVATLPLLFFGTGDQKRRYLPRLASGEWIGAFALTEANSGSDALSAQTKAVRTEETGDYTLNGAKVWITNGGFADLITCFGTLEGTGLTAFLVERETAGLSASREEHKLGLRGSSTTRILLEGATVPSENLLGEIGNGRLPALAALNLGRFAIAATALGMCKENLRAATQYALERRQFSRPIAEFGLIRQKLAEMAIRMLVLESMLYRTAGYLDARFGAISADGPASAEQYRSAAEEYAVECAILKVFGTETLDFVVDEALQIHGGYGFSEEFPIAQAYRDSRVFRIFEGTNEINRITIVDQILRRIDSGRVILPENARQASVNTNASAHPEVDETAEVLALADMERCQVRIRGATQVTIALCRALLAEGQPENQDLVGFVADMIVACYAAESVWLRCRQTEGAESLSHAGLAYARDAQVLACAWSRTILSAVGGSGPALDPPDEPVPGRDTIGLRRSVASAVVDRSGYPW